MVAAPEDHPSPMTDRSWQALSLSQTGASHGRRGTVCEDRSQAGVARADAPWSERGLGDWAYVVVADGHGSDNSFRSDRGAELAVAVLTRAFGEFRRALLEPDGYTRSSAAAIWKDSVPQFVVAGWRASIYQDLLADPPSIDAGEAGLGRFLQRVLDQKGHPGLELAYTQLRNFQQHAEETHGQVASDTPLPPTSGAGWDSASWGAWQAKAYGATLLGVLISPDALHWLQLGDGAMVEISGGEARYLVPPPSEAIGNETPSLSADDAVLSINVGTAPFVKGHVPSAVILATDGVPNSYDEIEGFFAFCRDIALDAPDRGYLERQLPNWLAKISEGGSGDDMSVAMAWATEASSRRRVVVDENDPRDETDPGQEPEQNLEPETQPKPEPWYRRRGSS